MRKIVSSPLGCFFSLAANHSQVIQKNSHHFLQQYGRTNILIFTYHRWIQAWSFVLRDTPVFVAISCGIDGSLASRLVNNVCPSWNVVKTNPVSLLHFKKIDTPKCLLLAVDGPKGPLFSIPHSAIALARSLQAMILPVGVHFVRSISMCSWDRIELALPWITQSVLIWGEPYTKHLESTDAHSLLGCNKQLRRKMISLSQEAKISCR